MSTPSYTPPAATSASSATLPSPLGYEPFIAPPLPIPGCTPPARLRAAGLDVGDLHITGVGGNDEADEYESAFIPALQPLAPHEVLDMIFAKALIEDYVAIYERKPIKGVVDPKHKDDYTMARRGPIQHGRHGDIYRILNKSKGNPVYINLGSYRTRSMIPTWRLFSAKKTTATAIHGVAVDLDVGRDLNDRKAHVPGALLTQAECLWKFNALVFLGKIPPPHIWANGTRGCYAIWLFEEPVADMDEAFRKWKIVRECYLVPRLRELAVDERFRAIIQNLKAPGACEVVKYFKVVDATTEDPAPLTSLDEMLAVFRNYPEQCDVPEPKAPKRRNEDAVESKPVRNYGAGEHSKRANVDWCLHRAEEMMKVTRHFGGEPDYPRREYMRDLASALKTYHYRRSPQKDWYRMACEQIENHNAELARPLAAEKLEQIIHDAKLGSWFNPEASGGAHTAHRSTKKIVEDMSITESLCEELGLVHLRKPFYDETRARAIRDSKIASAAKRERKAQAKAAARKEKEDRRAAAKQKKADAQQAKAERRQNRQPRIDLLRELIRLGTPVSGIGKHGFHRQDVARERERMESEGEVLLPPIRLKRGRKPSAGIASQSTGG